MFPMHKSQIMVLWWDQEVKELTLNEEKEGVMFQKLQKYFKVMPFLEKYVPYMIPNFSLLHIVIWQKVLLLS